VSATRDATVDRARGFRKLDGDEATDPMLRLGRRLFLGPRGCRCSRRIGGARVQNWLEDVVAPIVSKDGTGLSALLPIGRFRIYTVTGSLPSRSRTAYSLRITGLVDTPMTLSYADLTAMPPDVAHARPSSA